MPFIKGQPKPPGSGRKKGSRPSPRTLRRGLQEVGFDLTEEFLKLYESAAEDAALRFQILKEIAKYTQPPAPSEDDDQPSPEESLPDDPTALLALVTPHVPHTREAAESGDPIVRSDSSN